MEHKVFSEVEKFSTEKHIHVPLFNGERTKTVLLCLSAGLTVTPHSHPGFEVTLQPIKGKGLLPLEDGKEITLSPGEIVFMDGAASFSPRNPFNEDFQLLIHLVKK
jgi:quercetin dioxygenase-like cupin family protein